MLAQDTQTYLPEIITKIVSNTEYYLVENERTARRFIASLNTSQNIRDLHFYVLDKRSKPRQLNDIFAKIPDTANIGVISEAGCPGIADPGALAVSYAHQKDIEVIALPGPSSIFLALMSSGFSGQQFTFHGYIPLKNPQRSGFLQKISEKVIKKGETQIFMETPYRNDQLFKDLLTGLHPDMQLCIAANLTAPDQFVKTLSVKQWKKQKLDINKKPAIFLIGAA
ncbi:SAM-dependent methyltransferase [Chondrinema litorale]|uniref:SAM-dependent methyltransferase n=1 Tax=Chondrinema litorale TaxID=2994555 RepID=UPI0025429750|nr:SAM-dependent methyltransferase [Chondrinema litorale]UZR95542.1 SAM-dependent methyltransferase [Chondrinema litorale]